jgi:hypothetical protein
MQLILSGVVDTNENTLVTLTALKDRHLPKQKMSHKKWLLDRSSGLMRLVGTIAK